MKDVVLHQDHIDTCSTEFADTSLTDQTAQRLLLVSRLRRLSYVSGVISLCLVVLGLVAVLASAPQYPYPINVGGGCAFGLMGMLKAGVMYWVCIEVERMANTGKASLCYRRFTWGALQWTIHWLDLIAGVLSLIFSGVLTTRACYDTIRTNGTDVIATKACGVRPSLSLGLSICIIVLSGSVLVTWLGYYMVKKKPIMKEFERKTEDMVCCGKVTMTEVVVSRSRVTHDGMRVKV